ncbi:hypothetical protein [Stieleria varia]|uniref:Uncharacterized protein n=1 Tax=Stieleria varia TaxID=2528005 RepID=A0A5C6A559_9BACT|nr:hypothetical protein [Stieleria varia]TWT94566.1 hypothetical protein Pla52n_53870 [Stieleria varia]
MRYLAAFCTIALLYGNAVAQEFEVSGTDDVFVINPSILQATPKWDPEFTDIPVGAARAIKIAREYHDNQEFTGFSALFKWEVSGCALVREDDQRWYWIVQFRGQFAPEEMLAKKGIHAGGGSFPGPKTIFHRIPVLLTGKLTPTKIDFLPPAVKRVHSEEESP